MINRQKLLISLKDFTNGGDSFNCLVFRLITKAQSTPKNMTKLVFAFPEYVSIWLEWQRCADEEKFFSNKGLQECNTRIKNIKKAIKRFKNYRRWYKPLNYGMYSEAEIKEWIDKYKLLLRLEVGTKRMILNEYRNENYF